MNSPCSTQTRRLVCAHVLIAALTPLTAPAVTLNWLGGDGEWNTSSVQWSGDATVWPSTGEDNDAVFGAGTGSVQVASGGIFANDLSFAVDGYVIGGAALGLNGISPTLYAAPAVTGRVDAVLSGGSGLVKDGGGTLLLTGANTWSGPTLVRAGTLRVGNGGATGTLGGGSAATLLPGATLAYFRSNNALPIANPISGAGTLRFEGTGVSLQSDYIPSAISAGFTGQVEVVKARLRADTSTSGFGGASRIIVQSGAGVGLGFNSGPTVTNAFSLAGTGWPETNGPYGALRLENGTTVSGPITLTANATILGLNTSGGGAVSGLVDNGGFTLTLEPRNGPLSLGGAISGAGGLAKAGAGILNVTTPQGYGGGTSINAGTLALSGGNDVLPVGTIVNFGGTGTLNLGSTQQTLANLSAANGVTGTVTGGAGTLTLLGNNFAVGGTVHNTAQTLDLRNLGRLVFNNPTRTFLVGGQGGDNSTETGTLFMALTNTVIASQFNVATVTTGGTNVRKNTGTVHLGKTNVIQANTIQLGMVNNTGVMQFRAGVANPTLTLRGTTGGLARVTTLILGEHQTPWANTAVGTLDLTTGITGTSWFDARVDTLYVGMKRGRNDNGGDANGTLQMGLGTLDANTVFVLHRTNGGGGTARGTLSLNGGTLLARSLTLGYNTGGGAATATVNLNGGSTLMVGSMDAGAGAVTRAFNWNNGTVQPRDDTSDLTISEGLTLALAATGTHAFQIPSNRVGVVSASISGGAPGTTALTKTGAGTLVLNGSSTFAGHVLVQEGIVRVTEPQAYTGRTVLAGGTLRLGGDTTLPVAGSQLWLDAGTLDGSSPVAAWTDGSGNGRNATQATAANQPLSTTSPLLGGRKVVSFDGTSDFLGVNLSFLTGSSYTIFAVEGRKTSAANQYFLGSGSGTTNTSLHFGYRNNTTFTLAQYANDLDAPVPGFAAQAFRVWNAGLDTTSGHTVHLNGARIASNANMIPFISSNGGLVGKSYGTTYYNGELAELLLYNSALTGPQRAAVDLYLKRKWFGLLNPLPTTTEVALESPGTTFDLNGVDQTIGLLTGVAGSEVTLGTGTLTTGTGATHAFAGVISGPGHLVKAGSGQLTLEAANTYAGSTTLSNGTLRVTGSTGTGLLTVAAGARLTGSGSAGGSVRVRGELAPGDPVGLFSIGGDLEVAPEGTLHVELGTTGDSLAITGGVHLAGTLLITDAGGLTYGTYPLITHGGAVTVSNLVFGASPLPGAGFALDTNTVGRVDVLVVTAWEAWQLHHFQCTNCVQAAATADPDGDGMVNADEYIAGTVPTEAGSIFTASAVGVETGGHHRVEWSSVGGRTYRVLFRDGDLPGLFAEIPQDIVDPQPAGTPGVLRFVDDFSQTGGAPPAGTRYYRVRVLP